MIEKKGKWAEKERDRRGREGARERERRKAGKGNGKLIHNTVPNVSKADCFNMIRQPQGSTLYHNRTLYRSIKWVDRNWVNVAISRVRQKNQNVRVGPVPNDIKHFRKSSSPRQNTSLFYSVYVWTAQ